ncbi:hypothetical protein RQP46_003502 [Phenoliferia psychrophenolica]
MTPPANDAPLAGKAAPAGFDFNGGDLAALTQPPKFANFEDERAYLKERLCAAFRIFASQDFDHGVMTVSDLILVSNEGKVIGGGKPGRRVIHSAIHKARPDVNAICHSHSLYGKTFSSLGKPLAITTQDSCKFHNDCALLTNFGGVVIDDKEGGAIAGALGQKKAIILQNHGILTVGATIDSAVWWFISLEKQCQVQLLGEAAGTPIDIDEPQAVFTHKQVGSERSGYFSASPYFQVIDRKQGADYRQ